MESVVEKSRWMESHLGLMNYSKCWGAFDPTGLQELVVAEEHMSVSTVLYSKSGRAN